MTLWRVEYRVHGTRYLYYRRTKKSAMKLARKAKKHDPKVRKIG